jgi:hypothetical protein
VFIGVLFIIATKNGKNSSAIKKKGALLHIATLLHAITLLHSTAWMNLEDSILSESKNHKGHLLCYSHMKFKIGKPIRQQ